MALTVPLGIRRVVRAATDIAGIPLCAIREVELDARLGVQPLVLRVADDADDRDPFPRRRVGGSAGGPNVMRLPIGSASGSSAARTRHRSTATCGAPASSCRLSTRPLRSGTRIASKNSGLTMRRSPHGPVLIPGGVVALDLEAGGRPAAAERQHRRGADTAVTPGTCASRGSTASKKRDLRRVRSDTASPAGPR